MSKGKERTIFYFDEKGPVNTEKTLSIALAHAKEAGIKTIVVASSTGETALKLHQMAENAVKIIAVTSFAMSGDREKVMEAGADGYISKPINTRQFPEIIQDVLNK